MLTTEQTRHQTSCIGQFEFNLAHSISQKKRNMDHFSQLLHNHQQEVIQQQLEDFLEHRPNRESLIGKHILKEIPIAPSLIQISKQLEWNKRSCSLQRKIYNRPSLSILVERGIVKGFFTDHFFVQTNLTS